MALQAFLKQNKVQAEEVLYPASKAFLDEKGAPMMWRLKPLKSRDADKIRKVCNSYGKGGKVSVDNAKFNRMVVVNCVVEPNLKDAELQDSYGVMGEEELVLEMLDNDGEYQALVKKCLQISGYSQNDTELVDEVKN